MQVYSLFKHVVYSHGQQELRPDIFDKDRADASRDNFQKITDAINQILVSKLKRQHSQRFLYIGAYHR